MDLEQLKANRIGEACKSLLNNANFNVFLDAIREQAEIVAYATMVSGCDSFEDYQKQRGVYLGLRQVLDTCEDSIFDIDNGEPNNE